jgi:sugar phosphate isomerase/epimerase
LLAAKKQDIFQYIEDCKALGCTQLDPWNAHLPVIKQTANQISGGDAGDAPRLSADQIDHLQKVRAAADKAGLPFGCMAVDGAHILGKTEEETRANRARASLWIEAAMRLGARQVRIDAGGTDKMPDDQFQSIVTGYRDLVRRAGEFKIEVLMENHWGVSPVPKNVVKILDAVPGLGLLFDSNNWAPGMQYEGWLTCAKYARATHIKTFAFAEDGEELVVNIGHFIRLLKQAGYSDAWGVESVPLDGNEIEGARKTIALIRKYA